MISIDSWPSLEASEIEYLKKATDQVHHAAQFIAMAGKHFIPDRPDDSHTNLGWDLEYQRFEGHPIVASQPIQLALRPDPLMIQVLNEEKEVLISQPLIGHTREEVLGQIKSILLEFGLDTSKYDLDLHYEIPDHGLLHGSKFKELHQEDYIAFAKVRSIGEIALRHRLEEMGRNDAVRTWPHHFDHGAYLPLQSDAKGVLNSISLGLAVMDAVVDDYYFYVTHQRRNTTPDYNNLPDLPYGYWNRDTFAGAILPLQEILQTKDPQSQANRVDAFLESAIQASIKLVQ